MPAPIIPTDPLDRALGRIVHLLPLADTATLDASFQLEPVARVRTLVDVIMRSAKSDQRIVAILRQPGLLEDLKNLALTRQSEHAGADAPVDQARST